MGAEVDQAYAFGKTPREAWQKLKEEKLYEYGHDPYGGHLGLKPGFVLSSKPKDLRLSARKWETLIWDNDNADRPSDIKLPSNLKHRQLESRVYRDVQAFNGKWEPALCIPVTAAEEKDLRERYGYKRKKGNFYLFIGWCPC